MKLIALTILALLSFSSFSQEKNKSIKTQGIPYPLEWVTEPVNFSINDGRIEIEANANTNMFYSPDGNYRASNIPKLLFQPDSDYVFSAKVNAKLKSKWEAGVLMVYANEDYWAKLCFENESPGNDRIVTVVTNEISDDANSYFVDGESVYMQIFKKGQAIQFRYSTDGKNWIMVRHFTLRTDDAIKIGFASQSPIGKGLTSYFSEIKYEKK